MNFLYYIFFQKMSCLLQSVVEVAPATLTNPAPFPQIEFGAGEKTNPAANLLAPGIMTQS